MLNIARDLLAGLRRVLFRCLTARAGALPGRLILRWA